MASLNEVADKLNISVQTIYKRKKVDKELADAIDAGSIKKGRRIELNESAIEAITEAFKNTKKHNKKTEESETIRTLREQLEVKDKQIEQLQVLLNQQQVLMLSFKPQTLLEAPREKKKWFWQK